MAKHGLGEFHSVLQQKAHGVSLTEVLFHQILRSKIKQTPVCSYYGHLPDHLPPPALINEDTTSRYLKTSYSPNFMANWSHTANLVWLKKIKHRKNKKEVI